MTTQHTARLARARELLATSFDVSNCALACYSAAGFSADLRSAAGPGLAQPPGQRVQRRFDRDDRLVFRRRLG